LPRFSRGEIAGKVGVIPLAATLGGSEMRGCADRSQGVSFLSALFSGKTVQKEAGEMGRKDNRDAKKKTNGMSEKKQEGCENKRRERQKNSEPAWWKRVLWGATFLRTPSEIVVIRL
jgi:hypothetical protein